MKLYLGIDGGGTKTTAAVSDENGRILLKKTGKTINFFSVGMDRARENLDALLCAVCGELGETQFEAAFIGCSALDGEADNETVQKLCSSVNAKKIRMHSDVYIALHSLEDGECPCVAICGTGSMATGLDLHGNTVVVGGWGHILGDEGSAYSIALHAFSRCCELCDEEKETLLLKKAQSFFGVDSFRQAIDRIYAEDTSKDVIAAFASTVGEICTQDKDAGSIIVCEAQRFAKTVLTLLGKVEHCTLLGLYGGVFCNNELFTQTFTDCIKAIYPQIETRLLKVAPEESALRLAREL